MIRLFTSWYAESNETRNSELVQCLRRNIENPAIDEICLLLERAEAPIDDSKLFTRTVESRPTYQNFFAWANERSESPDDISIICNSDIHFDNSIRVFERHLQPQRCVALTRWEASEQIRLYDHNDSQDSWIFRGRIKDVHGDFFVGVPRCDNRILHELKQCGYDVINPAFSVRSYHLHAGERTAYADVNLPEFVPPPYEYLWPHNLCSLPNVLFRNLIYPDSKIGWRLDRRWIRSLLPFRIMRRIKTMARGR